MDRTLRWMTENLRGALTAEHPPGHKNQGRHCTNSGSGILICCYIDALGKVLTKGEKGSSVRFRKFVTVCMPGFIEANSTKALPKTPAFKHPNGKPGGGNVGGEYWLYEVYRCGFVHGFYPTAGSWGRSSHPHAKFWSFDKNRKPVLIIDVLAKEFLNGIERFKQKAEQEDDLRDNFGTYITAGNP